MDALTRRRVVNLPICSTWDGSGTLTLNAADCSGLAQHQITVACSAKPSAGVLQVSVRPPGARFYVPAASLDLTINGSGTLLLPALLDGIALSFSTSLSGGTIAAALASAGNSFLPSDIDQNDPISRRRLIVSAINSWIPSVPLSVPATDHSGLAQHQISLTGGVGVLQLLGRHPQSGAYVSVSPSTDALDASGSLAIFSGIYDSFQLVPVGTVTGTVVGQLASIGTSLFYGPGLFSSYLPADDALVVHKAGAETITGSKTFNASIIMANGTAISTPGGAKMSTGPIGGTWTIQQGGISNLTFSLADYTGATQWLWDQNQNLTTTKAAAFGSVTSSANVIANTNFLSSNQYLVVATNNPGGVFFRPNGVGSVTGQTVVDQYGVLTVSGNLIPEADNTRLLGVGSLRWAVVYSATGSINTSDAREKTTVVPMTAAEVACAADLAHAIGTYQWLAAIQLKGAGDARHHIGLTVQDAIAIMQARGLDPFAYGFICYDQWPESPELTEDIPEVPAVLDVDGNVVTPAVPATVIVVQAYAPAGDRYSFRTDELCLFIAKGLDARLSALEAKLI